jgi:hypothetical protein
MVFFKLESVEIEIKVKLPDKIFFELSSEECNCLRTLLNEKFFQIRIQFSRQLDELEIRYVYFDIGFFSV